MCGLHCGCYGGGYWWWWWWRRWDCCCRQKNRSNHLHSLLAAEFAHAPVYPRYHRSLMIEALCAAREWSVVLEHAFGRNIVPSSHQMGFEITADNSCSCSHHTRSFDISLKAIYTCRSRTAIFRCRISRTAWQGGSLERP